MTSHTSSRSAGVPPASVSFALPTYEGPLDLLLQLVRENQVDIYDIPIAEITRQYLERLAAWQSLDLTVAGEYLVMAATLLEIKSRMLLPAPPRDDEADQDPRAELVERLLEYQRYAGVTDDLRRWEDFRSRLFFRNAAVNPDDYILPTEPGSLRGQDLALVLQRMLGEAGTNENQISAIVPRQRFNLRLKMVEVMRAVRRQPQGVAFTELIGSACSLSDIVVTFLAVLELLRSGRARVIQRRPLHDFRVLLRKDDANPTPTEAAQEVEE